MKKRIYFYFCSITLVAVILTSAMTLLAFYNFFDIQAQNNVKAQSEILTKSLNYTTNNQEYLRSLSLTSSQARVSIIDRQGTVLFDTYADVSALTSHEDRPEIKSAFKTGVGSSSRFSGTLGENTYYYATILNDDTVLRLASTSSSIYSVFIKILPLIFIIIIGGFIVCVFLARLLTKRIINPIEKLSQNIDTSDGYYDELSPFVNKIGHQNAELKKREHNLKEQKNTLNIITDSMNEGLILLDKNSVILSSNRSAGMLLGAKDDNFEGKSLMTMCRDIEFNEVVRSACSGEAQNLVMQMNSKHIEVFASPILYKNNLTGIAIFIVDITSKQAAEQMRREFSANVSHELKTPLTSISGYAEMLANDMAKKDDVKIFAQKIHSEATRLVSLIEDIISLSRLDEKLSDKNFSMISIEETAKAVCENLNLIAKEKNVKLTVLGENREVLANPNMLYELINNLVDNAIKYNKIDGEVTIQINADNFTVTDSGIGIPLEHQERIFERFYRVDKSRSKKTGGTGLGLAIVKHIASYHDASVSITSTENVGTTITVNM